MIVSPDGLLGATALANYRKLDGQPIRQRLQRHGAFGEDTEAPPQRILLPIRFGHPLDRSTSRMPQFSSR
jgi:hypothetical protein